FREEERPELADAVVRLPLLAAEGDTERIRAVLPSALRALREADGFLPVWLEGYYRHWPLAARVGHRGEGTAALAAAEEALGAAQNVLDCYANIDGPGRTADRTALLAEAMAHSCPGHPAWEALVVAHADMLIDDERPEEAVRELDLRAAEIREAGAEVGMEYGF